MDRQIADKGKLRRWVLNGVTADDAGGRSLGGDCDPGAERKNFAEPFGLWIHRGAPTPTAVEDQKASWDGGSRV
jgi:hypothetical protein